MAGPVAKEGKKAWMAHVQGLRGLAIALVVMYHLNPEVCPCGYFGVDLFLVISGFLILRNGTNQWDMNRYGSYLLKKWWRIFPAVFIVCLPVFACCLLWMHPDRIERAAFVLGGTMAGIGNEMVARCGGYFDLHAQENPFLHLWYVGVVMQLYLVVGFVVRLRERIRGAVLWTAGVVSLCLYVLLNIRESSFEITAHTQGISQFVFPYYSTMTRLWEPLAASVILTLPSWQEHRALRAGMALLGAALALAPVWTLSTGTSLCYGAVVGCVLLLRYADTGLAGKLLRVPPIQWLGKVSFSLYLVHWPLIVLWKYVVFRELFWWEYAVLFIVSLLLAWLLYEGVERRCIGWKEHLGKKAFGVTMGVMVAGVAIIGGCIGYERMNCGSYCPVSKDFLDGFPSGALADPPLVIGDKSKTPFSFLLLGDSHSWHLHGGLNQCCNETADMRGIYLNNPCIPATNCFTRLIAGKACWDRNKGEGILAWLKNSPQIETVIISVFWHLRLSNTNLSDWDFRRIPPEECRRYLISAIIDYCKRLQACGKRVIIVADTPHFSGDRDPVDTYYRDPKRRLPSLSREQWEKLLNQDADFYEAVRSAGIELLDVSDHLSCETGDLCFISPERKLLYRDSDHLSLHGSYYAAKPIIEYIRSGQSHR